MRVSSAQKSTGSTVSVRIIALSVSEIWQKAWPKLVALSMKIVVPQGFPWPFNQLDKVAWDWPSSRGNNPIHYYLELCCQHANVSKFGQSHVIDHTCRKKPGLNMILAGCYSPLPVFPIPWAGTWCSSTKLGWNFGPLDGCGAFDRMGTMHVDRGPFADARSWYHEWTTVTRTRTTLTVQ